MPSTSLKSAKVAGYIRLHDFLSNLHGLSNVLSLMYPYYRLIDIGIKVSIVRLIGDAAGTALTLSHYDYCPLTTPSRFYCPHAADTAFVLAAATSINTPFE